MWSEGNCIYLVHAGHRLEAGTLGTLAACRRELTYSRRRSSGGQGKDTHTLKFKHKSVSRQDREEVPVSDYVYVVLDRVGLEGTQCAARMRYENEY